MNAMYTAYFVLKNGTTLEGHINEYTRNYLIPRLRKFTFKKHLNFDLYKREPKTANSTGWGHQCYVELNKKDIVLFTYSHTKY
jgi:hypothetical protein